MSWVQPEPQHLERQELTATVPPAHTHAHRLLRNHGLTVLQVVSVDADSVLYLGSGRRPMTAWLERTGSFTRVLVEPGFQPWQTDAAQARVPVEDEDGDLGEPDGPFGD